MSKRRWVLVSLAALLVVFGLVVRFVGDPVLLRFPLNTDQTLHYRGTATVGVNPANMAPLATPLRFPLTVNRTVRVKSGSYSQAVIDETISMTFAGSTRTEAYQYVMDRRSMMLRDSPWSYAFGNKLDRMPVSGSYRIDLPMGTSSGELYRVWAPEIGESVPAVPTGPAHQAVLTGRVITFDVHFVHRVAPYYLAYLGRSGLPSALSGTSLAAVLAAHGANTGAVLGAVSPSLTATQLADLRAQIAGLHVPLRYSYFEQGQISIQPGTGALVDSKSTHEGVSVSADLSALRDLTTTLATFDGLPAVQRLDGAVAAMSAPSDVLDLSYAQTPSSVRAVTATADSQATTIALVSWQLPTALVGLGVLLLLLAMLWRPSRRAGTVTALSQPADRVTASGVRHGKTA